MIILFICFDHFSIIMTIGVSLFAFVYRRERRGKGGRFYEEIFLRFLDLCLVNPLLHIGHYIVNVIPKFRF